MEIDKSQCDGGVIRSQSTNLLQVKGVVILCLKKKKDMARRDCEAEYCAKMCFCAHFYDWDALCKPPGFLSVLDTKLSIF